MMPTFELQPLVSCIMPTHNRRQWVPRSIACFLAQDYEDCELIILDDGADNVRDLVPENPRIRYHRLDRRLSVGAKRNVACELARGDLIAHWDDDDWYPSWRLSRQTMSLTHSPAELCGTSHIYYINHAGRKAFRYVYRGRPWVGGNTFMYRRSLWQRNHFPDLQVGEDFRFLSVPNADKILDLKDARLCVASLHESNTGSKHISGTFWQEVRLEEVQQLLDPSTPAPAEEGNVIPAQIVSDHSCTHYGYKTARESDLSLPEFVAFNFGQDLPHMRRWELPWSLFAAQLGNTMGVLDCTINPVTFPERIARLYPHVQYRHVSPVQNGAFRLPFGVPDAGFDRVFCINTLEHLLRDQREALVAELARKLKPGGLLLLTSDYYFDSSWNSPAFLNAGVMRPDCTEFFGGWNKITIRDWNALCQSHGLLSVDTESVEDPQESDLGCYLNPAPHAHATIAGVFSKGPATRNPAKRVLLALLTWNTCDVSLASLRAYLKEAQMLCRLGCEPCLCVCDNGSTDGTQAALQELDRQIEFPHKFILNRENRGNSVARNQIIEYMLECCADYVLFMDGDIEVVPFSSFAMLRYMENSGGQLGCIGADSWGQSPDPLRVSPCLYSLDGMRLEDLNLVAWTQYGMFRRAVFERGIRFDERGPFEGPGWGFEDNDLAFQMDVEGFRNQRFFGMTYLHRAARSSVRIMRQIGLDPHAIFERRRQYVINKWASVVPINDGPLVLVRRAVIQV
jgi:glycosyltransferase involved in cell wall biosynthesis